ncbi:MAG TPA: hypothetical protein VG013_12160 [Gemmataceae bacterium]|nr:hypothetical protein [Gemmataceae bacterium]
MHELTFGDPCIVFALRRESRAFQREFPPHQRFPGAPCRARFCGPSWLSVLVLETGLGPARTATALGWLLNRPVLGNLPYRPKVILSAGFSGALQEKYQVGDIILATEVADLDGNRWPATWPDALPAGKWQPPLHRDRLLTVSRPAGDPAEKRALGQQHGAGAVDMETAVVARLCSRHGVPFGCVRAISDRLDTPLSPKVLSVLKDGRVRLPRLLMALAGSPRLAAELWRLARDTRMAAEQLRRALGEILTLTLSWAADL